MQDVDEELVPGVIYLGHIPHGFYEKEIKNFFEQFGTVNRVRLSRSKKVSTKKIVMCKIRKNIPKYKTCMNHIHAFFITVSSCFANVLVRRRPVRRAFAKSLSFIT